MLSIPKQVASTCFILACVTGCTNELAQRQTPDQQRSELARQEEWRAWSQTMNTWDPRIGEEFLQQYPDSVYRDRVREKVAELRAREQDRPVYEPYLQKNTIEGYMEFVSKYPNNAYVSEARARLAELEYAPYRDLNTALSYEQFLTRYPNHKYAQDAKERLELLRPSLPASPSHVSHPFEVIVTGGPLSQPYEALGEVHVDTRGMLNFGSALNDALFRSPLAVAVGGRTPVAHTEQMNKFLKEKAREQYGSKVDAVINVTYQTDHDGDVYASGLAVHFTEPQPTSAPTQTTTTKTLEERLRELRDLREKNLITPEEYYEKRSELLKGL